MMRAEASTARPWKTSVYKIAHESTWTVIRG